MRSVSVGQSLKKSTLAKPGRSRRQARSGAGMPCPGSCGAQSGLENNGGRIARRIPDHAERDGHTSAILMVLGARKVSDQGVRAELSHFVSQVGAVPVIVVANSDEPAEILAALESGARGYIPTSVKVRVAAEAIGLARAGGIFVPASSILRLREVIHAASGSTRPLSGMFTTRQAGVVEAIRQGKPNKIIAYELNLCESTVKDFRVGIVAPCSPKQTTRFTFSMKRRRDGEDPCRS